VAERPFVSWPRTGHRLALPFEKIGDSHWTTARQQRAMVAELDRLEVPDSADIQLRHRTDDDELPPVGWSLNITVSTAAPRTDPTGAGT
jgi:hypothetical protein